MTHVSSVLNDLSCCIVVIYKTGVRESEHTILANLFSPRQTPRPTVALQAPVSMEFFRQEHWSGLPFPTPGHLPELGFELASLGRWILHHCTTWEALSSYYCSLTTVFLQGRSRSSFYLGDLISRHGSDYHYYADSSYLRSGSLETT